MNMDNERKPRLPEDDDHESGYGLVLPFDSDEPEFRRGMEVGIMWAHLNNTDRREFMIHADNVEMAIRLGESLRMEFASEDVNDDWIMVRYGEAVNA